METGIESYLRYLKGDPSEMRTIVSLYWDGMLLFTNSYVHNLSDAEDIAQEALIRLAFKRPKLAAEPQLKSYLLRICRNLALNHLKRQKRLTALPQEIMEQTEDDTIHIEQRMELAEEKAHLHHAMLQLKQQYYEILYLRYFEELSITECARVLHCTAQQAAAYAYQARQQLRKILEKEGFSVENL